MQQPTVSVNRRRHAHCAFGIVVLAATLLVACGGKSATPASSTAPAGASTTTPSSSTPDSTAPATTNALGLPSINAFRENPSDRFPVDYGVIRAGHPFKGKNALTPHTGAHIVFGDGFTEWPKGGTAPENFPPIYAVADGIVSRVDTTLAVGENDRYGVNLSIAASGSAVIDFEYSIEPMVKEPSAGFYASFIKVKQGDRVKKGDIIAYMYLPQGSTGAHIHFELINGATGEFMAPAIFDKVTVGEFYYNWKGQGFDSNGGYDNPIPPCMGWKIDASENPFANEAVECLAYPDPSGA